MAQLWVLCLLSFRNLFSHKLKSTIVGSIMIFGTFLVVMGTALLDSVERSMAKSITASIAGHVQVYSAQAKDELALFGGGFMGGEDVGRIDRFEEVRQALSKVENVKAVVPMGIAMASVTSVGELERALSAMRIALRENKLKPLPGLKVQVREIAEQMKVELNNSAAIAKERDKIDKGLALLDSLEESPDVLFWRGRFFEELDRTEDAIAAFDAALRAAPDSPVGTSASERLGFLTWKRDFTKSLPKSKAGAAATQRKSGGKPQ